MTGFQQMIVWITGIACTLGTVMVLGFFFFLVKDRTEDQIIALSKGKTKPKKWDGDFPGNPFPVGDNPYIEKDKQ